MPGLDSSDCLFCQMSFKGIPIHQIELLESEKFSVAQALRAITSGAAYTLKLDEEIGSIETGERADCALLDNDPDNIAPEALKDLNVWGTVRDEHIFSTADL